MGRAITIDERWLRFAAWAIICLLIFGLAAGVGGYLVLNPPQPEKKKLEVVWPTVLVEEVVVGTRRIELSSQGEAQPQRRTTMSAEVAGQLVVVDARFEAGETFAEGELLLQIDPADYQAALAAAQSTLADAELNLELEEVRKGQALRDWKKLGNGEEPSDLVKRVPQLASARAKITAAQAAVDKALRDLVRTEIRAPYDCRIERTRVDRGAVVAPGVPLVDLVSRGPVEVRLPLSLEDYGYLQRDEAGRVVGEVSATGKIGGQKETWQGTLLRSEEIVEQRTRSINVVVLFGAEGSPAPPIGMFVEATIVGKAIPGVAEVPRTAMLNGSEVLLVRKKGSKDVLEFRKVEVMRTEKDVILVTGGLQAGERVVVTPPSAPVAGGQVEVLPEPRGESEAQGSRIENNEKDPAPE